MHWLKSSHSALLQIALLNCYKLRQKIKNIFWATRNNKLFHHKAPGDQQNRIFKIPLNLNITLYYYNINLRKQHNFLQKQAILYYYLKTMETLHSNVTK